MTVKKILLTLVALFILNSLSWGQVALVRKTYELLESKDYEKARQAIELASEDVTTAQDPETWFLKGVVYSEIYKAKEEHGINDIRTRATRAFRRSLDLDTASTYSDQSYQGIRFIRDTYYNEGVSHFNEQNFQAALDGFKSYLDLDVPAQNEEFITQAIFYVGYSYALLGNNDGALEYFEKARDRGYQDPVIYVNLVRIYEQRRELGKAMLVYQEGKKAFPDDLNLNVSGINLYMAAENFKLAAEEGERYLLQRPEDVQVMLVVGTAYGKLIKQADENAEPYFKRRIEIYEEVLAIEPDNFMANYNIGITYYNKAVDLINAQDYDVDILKFNQIVQESTELFRKSLPYILEANKYSRKNINTLRALEGIYVNLNNKEKLREVRAQLDQLN
jgi:tetratricopeptide (TPR) repeat protein